MLDDMFSTSKTPPKGLSFEQKKKREETVEEVFRICTLPLVCVGVGFWRMALWAVKNLLRGLLFWGLALIAGYWATCEYLHLRIIYHYWPHDLVSWPEAWVSLFPFWGHQLFVTVTMLSPLAFVAGARMLLIRRKFHRIFSEVGLKNSLGGTPKLIQKIPLDQHRVQYRVDPSSLGIEDFQGAEGRLECALKTHIESIKYAQGRPGTIVITCNRGEFPEKVFLEDLEGEKALPQESFYIGESFEGPLAQRIQDLPHMLIAGSTGSGKSVFFKSCLVSLLESSPFLHLYIIDLKGGLEAIDFAKAPNVKIVKDMEKALELLREVKKEMMKRFALLEQDPSQAKAIDPVKHKKERIIVAIDEASVLYMKRGRYDRDYPMVMEARELADSLAKLSRVAGINLILATQKIDKDVIPTSVTENISGRMAFRTNSFQGSMAILGSKEAIELPEIPGRGIWNLGVRKVMIQAPFISAEEIKARCNKIRKDFATGQRKLLTPLFGQEGVDQKQISIEGFDLGNQVGSQKVATDS